MTVEEIVKQEQLLQFDGFNNEVAFEIGKRIYDKAIERKLPVAISISICNQQIFYVALEGATSNNQLWLKRKINTTYHFQESSMLIQLKYQGTKTMVEIHGLDDKEYSAAGGAFPIRVKGVGVVGVIAVSGLTSEKDHGLIIECLEGYLE